MTPAADNMYLLELGPVYATSGRSTITTGIATANKYEITDT